MTKKDRALPPRVFTKGRWHYLVTADGKRRVWVKLSPVREGLPALYRALADLEARAVASDMMPALVTAWRRDVSEALHSKKTQADDLYLTREIAERFAEFRAGDVRPPDVKEFLMAHRARPRTHNAYRSMLRELMRYAEEQGHREPGSNPVDPIRTMPVKARDRYITDSELRRIKVAAIYGDDGKRTRSGLMICALIDLAYLTGQRIGDLLTLQWSAVTDKGILFEPAKVASSTGAKVFISMTPRLQALVDRLRALRQGLATSKRRLVMTVIATQEGKPYTYSGAATAWKRALARAGVADVHFHDIRAKALTDVDELRGRGQARRMGGHSTETQTADYVRHKKALATGATR